GPSKSNHQRSLPMASPVGGILTFMIDGNQYPVRGNFEVMASKVKREGVAGQDYVHGYTEMPVVPGMKGDFTTIPGLSIAVLEAMTNVTATAQLANGRTYVATQAWMNAAFVIDSTAGKVGFDLGCITCEEL